jgi:hypothetical protein
MSDIPLYRFLMSLLFPLRFGALVKSGRRQQKPTKVKIGKYIQCQPMHMMKELCNKIRVILWERDMPLYYIK